MLKVFLHIYFQNTQFWACNPEPLLQSSNYSRQSVHISACSCVMIYSTPEGEMEHCACVSQGECWRLKDTGNTPLWLVNFVTMIMYLFRLFPVTLNARINVQYSSSFCSLFQSDGGIAPDWQSRVNEHYEMWHDWNTAIRGYYNLVENLPTSIA